MKILIISGSGNVGKTTLTREVIAGNLKKCSVIEVETHNLGNRRYANEFHKYNEVDPTEVTSIYKEMSETKNVVIDVGSSSYMEFIRQMEIYVGMLDTIDLFIIPTTDNIKQINDSILTAQTLIEKLNVEASKIIYLPNMVMSPDTITSRFNPIFKNATKMGIIADPNIYLPFAPALRDSEIRGKTVSFIMENTSNNRESIEHARKNKDTKTLDLLVKQDALRMASISMLNTFEKLYLQITNKL